MECRKGKHFFPSLTHLAIVLFAGFFLSAPLWLPHVRSCRVPKCLFLLCNIVIVFCLASESKLSCSAPTTDVYVYDEFMKASSERQAEGEGTKNSTTVDTNSVREEEVLEEEEEEKGWSDIDKKAEDFIARINWQRKLEERRLLSSGYG